MATGAALTTALGRELDRAQEGSHRRLVVPVFKRHLAGKKVPQRGERIARAQPQSVTDMLQAGGGIVM